MTTPTFRYVEDYIEFIAGNRNISGRQLGIFDTVPSPISLARYDVQIVDSMAEQTIHHNKAYTDKQSELAKKIVLKYRKQLSQLNPPVHLPEQLDQFRLGIRQIDRTRSLTIQNNIIEIRFPFDTKLIEAVKNQGRDGHGAIAFDRDKKIWKLALTESNLNWAVAIGSAYQFDIDAKIKELYDKMLTVEEQLYNIELIETATGFEITNAPTSMVDYINEHLNGFGLDNLLTLADNSTVLGYSLSTDLKVRLWEEYPNIASLVLTRTQDKTKFALEDIVDYARKVNRLPVYVYETGLPKKDTEEIKYLNRSKPLNIMPKLLVSMSELMIGSKKEAWRNNAEKIFYLTNGTSKTNNT